MGRWWLLRSIMVWYNGVNEVIGVRGNIGAGEGKAEWIWPGEPK